MVLNSMHTPSVYPARWNIVVLLNPELSAWSFDWERVLFFLSICGTNPFLGVWPNVWVTPPKTKHSYTTKLANSWPANLWEHGLWAEKSWWGDKRCECSRRVQLTEWKFSRLPKQHRLGLVLSPFTWCKNSVSSLSATPSSKQAESLLIDQITAII